MTLKHHIWLLWLILVLDHIKTVPLNTIQTCQRGKKLGHNVVVVYVVLQKIVVISNVIFVKNQCCMKHLQDIFVWIVCTLLQRRQKTTIILLMMIFMKAMAFVPLVLISVWNVTMVNLHIVERMAKNIVDGFVSIKRPVNIKVC